MIHSQNITCTDLCFKSAPATKNIVFAHKIHAIVCVNKMSLIKFKKIYRTLKQRYKYIFILLIIALNASSYSTYYHRYQVAEMKSHIL